MKVLISRKTGIFYYCNSKGDYHSKEGFVTEKDLNSGEKVVKSNTGVEFLVFDANNNDLVKKIKRGGPQVILPKDVGYVIVRSGLDKNSYVVEGGSGSGVSASVFGRFCSKVKSVEVREDHLKIAKENCEKLGIDNVEFVLGDMKDVVSKEKNVDLLFLDMPEPNAVVEQSLDCVKSGRYIVCYLPSIYQIHELVSVVFNRDDLYLEEVSEVILRHWRFKEKVSRPESRKEIDHTAFLVFLRKV